MTTYRTWPGNAEGPDFGNWRPQNPWMRDPRFAGFQGGFYGGGLPRPSMQQLFNMSRPGAQYSGPEPFNPIQSWGRPGHWSMDPRAGQGQPVQMGQPAGFGAQPQGMPRTAGNYNGPAGLKRFARGGRSNPFAVFFRGGRMRRF